MTLALFDVAKCEKIMTDAGMPPAHAQAVVAATSLALTQAVDTLIAKADHVHLEHRINLALAKQSIDLSIIFQKDLDKLAWRILGAIAVVSYLFVLAATL